MTTEPTIPMSLADYRAGPTPTDRASVAEWSRHFVADLATSGLGPASIIVQRIVDADETLSTLTRVDGVLEHVEEVARSIYSNEMAGGKLMLAAQAVALNAIFLQAATKAAAPSDDPAHSERALRLALDAQGLCRASIEALAVIRNTGPRE